MYYMAGEAAVWAGDFHCSYGSHILDHLSADGARLLGCEITVVAVLKIYTDLGSGFHFEAVESVLGVGYYMLCHNSIDSFHILI